MDAEQSYKVLEQLTTQKEFAEITEQYTWANLPATQSQAETQARETLNRICYSKGYT